MTSITYITYYIIYTIFSVTTYNLGIKTKTLSLSLSISESLSLFQINLVYEIIYNTYIYTSNNFFNCLK